MKKSDSGLQNVKKTLYAFDNEFNIQKVIKFS